MPGHGLHIELARTLLRDSDEWAAPAWRHDPEAVSALYNGAIGPDMGYFPGADSLLSGLAHYVRTVAMVRTLRAQASTDVEEAFALGWLTHVLADAEVHPIVNRAAGEIDFGSLDRPSTAADSMVTHVRVEVGLDGVRLARDPEVQRIRLEPTFDAKRIGFLHEAYRDTYGLAFDRAKLLKSHRAVARYQGVVFRFTTRIGQRHLGEPAAGAWLLVYKPVRRLSGLFARNSLAFGVTHTIAPASWVEDDVAKVVRSFPALVGAQVDTGLSQLPDINLDTGSLEDPADPYRLAVVARTDLNRRQQG